MNFIVKCLPIPAPLVKNKHIGELGYTFFLWMTMPSELVFKILMVYLKYNMQFRSSLYNMLILWKCHFLMFAIFGLILYVIELQNQIVW
jgi:hypothetical protein